MPIFGKFSTIWSGHTCWEWDAGLSRAITPTRREKSGENCHSFSCRYSFFPYSWCHMKSKGIAVDLRRQPEWTALFVAETPWRVIEQGFTHHVASLRARLQSCICPVWWAAACAECQQWVTPQPGAAPQRLCGAEGSSLLQRQNGNPPQFCWRKKPEFIGNQWRSLCQRIYEKCLLYVSIVLDESGAEILQERVCRRKGGTPKTLDEVQYSSNKTLRSRHHYKIIDCGEQSHIPRWSIGHLTYQ